jgi:exodeoxyribonuclease V gamma subunit
VVVSTLASMRPLPFRVVFACGMGEGRFPSPDAEDPLDLRWARRREGDVTARERDKYAFLELLLGARERLYASYVSRDALTGDALAPSSVVEELLHAIQRGYVADVTPLRWRHALRRWDARYFPELFGGEATPRWTMALPEARAEARTMALRRSLEERGARVDAHEVRARAESDPTWRALADHLRLARLPAAPPLADARIMVPMHALVKFLEFPLQGWARFRLGLDEIEDDDVLSRESEPFETELREETLLLREVLLGAARQGQPLDHAYDAVVRDRELRGLGPSGVFAAGERGDHVHALVTWREALETAHVPLESIEVHRFGRAGEHSRADRVHEPVVFELDVVDASGVKRIVRAEIAGRTLPLGAGASTSVTLSKRVNEGGDPWAVAGRQRSALRAFVDHAVLAASGVGAGKAHASLVVVATPEGAVTEPTAFAPLMRDEATGWLRGLVRELLAGPHAYFFPCEAVFVHRARGAEEPLSPVLEEARDKLRGGDGPPALRSAYGPVPRPHEYPAPDEARARAMLDQRFALLFRDPEAAARDAENAP